MKIREQTGQQVKITCHFKQVEDDRCFAYHFVNKKECQTCWKRFQFVSEYMPAKEEYDKRMESSNVLREKKLRNFTHWGNGIVVKNEVSTIKDFNKK